MSDQMIRPNYPYQTDKEIDDMFTDYLMEYPSEYERAASGGQSKPLGKGRYYTVAQISGLGDVVAIPEGGRVTFDTPVEGHYKQVQASKYGLGFAETEEMEEDDFHGKIPSVVESLSASAMDKVNIDYFSLFNDGNDTHTAWDAAYVFADSHTTMKSGDTIDNLGAAALSETSLQAAFEYFDNLVDEAGRKVNLKLDAVWVPTALQWTGHRLRNQMGGISTSGTAPNLSGNQMTTNPANGAVDSWRLEVFRYLTDDETWFAVSDKHQALLLWKRQIRMEHGNDFHTGSRLHKVTMRYVPAVFDYKGLYGAFV